MRNAGLIQTFGPSLGGGDCGALCALPVALSKGFWSSGMVMGTSLVGEKSRKVVEKGEFTIFTFTICLQESGRFSMF